jgi:hypothetical protein
MEDEAARELRRRRKRKRLGGSLFLYVLGVGLT